MTPYLDSAHIEICRIGSFHEKWGGVPVEELERIVTNGTTKIPQIAVIPTGIVSNKDIAPEAEARFDIKKMFLRITLFQRLMSCTVWNTMQTKYPILKERM